MEKFESEVLKSGIEVFAAENGFYVFNGEDNVHLTKSDINRLHGIAFPEKRHGSCEISNTIKSKDDE